MKAIEDRRKQIDRIDAELIRLLNRRAQFAIEIGEFKRRNGLRAVSVGREREILRRACASSGGPLDGKSIRRVFRIILAESRRTAASASLRQLPSEASR